MVIWCIYVKILLDMALASSDANALNRKKKVAEDETHRKIEEEEKVDCCDEICFFR